MVITSELAGIKIGDTYPTRIMAIINLSPTSYYKNSIKSSKDEIIEQIEMIEHAKVDFIDVGAISSAPSFLYGNQEKLTIKEEISRLTVFFAANDEVNSDIPVSIDTGSAKTAEYALSKGASVINDITGFKSDPNLAKVISNWNAGAVIMACRNTPGDVYTIETICHELGRSIKLGREAGIKESKMIIDPGLGGWTNERKSIHDYTIIAKLPDIRHLKKPILVGISRKSFIGKILEKAPEERLWGSLAATTAAILNGAHVIRTHDPMETKDCAIISKYIAKLGRNLD
ncbi:MAG: dihydropteroate synthase [Candidatus Heimdallarchaeota archaeon]|nr:dihydropteroate synthase [Candidatus Heimdallarchaeota archaeon]